MLFGIGKCLATVEQVQKFGPYKINYLFSSTFFQTIGVGGGILIIITRLLIDIYDNILTSIILPTHTALIDI